MCGTIFVICYYLSFVKSCFDTCELTWIVLLYIANNNTSRRLEEMNNKIVDDVEDHNKNMMKQREQNTTEN